MRLERWALVGEIVSALAIVVTLLFLLVELRDNTEAIKSQNLQAISDGIRQIALATATTPDLAELMYGETDFDTMPKPERYRIFAWITAWLKSAEESYLQYENGVLEQEVWLSRRSNVINLLQEKNLRAAYDALGPGTLVTGFADEIDRGLAEASGR